MLEAQLEAAVLSWFSYLGWQVLHGPDVSPDTDAGVRERSDWRELVLPGRLRAAVARLNPDLPGDAVDEAVKACLAPESQSVEQENWRAFQLLTQGVPVSYRAAAGSLRHDRAWLVDWDNPTANDLLALNQVTVKGPAGERRPDVVVFVNGLPLALLELKAPGQANATIRGAFNQIQTYRSAIPVAFTWNQVTVISDGVQARASTYSGRFEHYAPWKTVDGRQVVSDAVPQLQTLVQGMFAPEVFLDLVRNFMVFSDEPAGAVKKVAKYHQYWAVRKAVQRTLEAKESDGRAGVVWHTQGSGKSMEMHCYTGAIMRHPQMANPTVVVLTDRNDLDNQLFEEVFSSSRPGAPLPGAPVQADSREHLKELLGSRGAGGIVFSTIQKFGLSAQDRAAGRSFPLLSDRRNIVVLVDEAHRSNYDFVDGFARHLRDALPKATYIGFTGTPIEAADKSTRQVFGDYIDVYDLTQAVADGATVKVYYEARLAKIDLPAEALAALDEGFAEATSGTEEEAAERLKRRWSQVEAVIGAEGRIRRLAADLVEHWEGRKEQLDGKCMVVAMSRRIAVDLYDAIIALRPDWHSEDDDLGRVKVVITGSAADAERLQPHIRNKERRNALKARAKNPSDALEMVIVRDMWLTGFDAPPMHTMYVDKPMSGANLMQAITRINRTFKDKPAGLVVDYIGIADDLKRALADYTDRDRGTRAAGEDITDEVIPAVVERHEIVDTILSGHDWRADLGSGSPTAFLDALAGTVEYLLRQHIDDTGGPHPGGLQPCTTQHPCLQHRFMDQARRLRALTTLCAHAPQIKPLRDDLAFFDAVRGQIAKTEGPDRRGGAPGAEVDTAIKQLVSQAASGAGVIDIYAEAGIDRPELSLLDEEFVANFPRDPHPALTIEHVRRILDAEIARVGRRNVVAGRQFSEMLAQTVRRYQNRTLDSAQVIAELADLAAHLRAQQQRGHDLGLSEAELAFYDAIAANQSAVEQMADDTLTAIARELVAIVQRDAKTDWNVKEQVRAKLRTSIKRLLRRYKYPPDQAETAVQLVLQQAEVIAGEPDGV